MSLLPPLHPLYSITVPTTGQVIKVRPFNTREEKLLAMARLSEKATDRADTSMRVISNCIVEGEFDVSKATSIDVEYLTIFLRSKSVNEVIEEVTVTDPDTQKQTVVDVFLDEMYIEPKPAKGPITLVLDEDYDAGVVISYPTFSALQQFQQKLLDNGIDLIDDKVEADQVDNDAVIEASLWLYSTMISKIWVGDQVIITKDIDQQEVINWIGELQPEQYGKLEKFLAELPRVKIPINIVDKATKQSKKIVMTGFESFFFSSPDTPVSLSTTK